MKELIFVSGKLCCGKGYVIERDFTDYFHIVVSDVVRNIIGRTDRRELANTANLDVVIVNEIIKLIRDCHCDVVIDGTRQPSIYEMLVKEFYGEYNIKTVWIHAAENIRQKRFEDRASEKDYKISFKTADHLDKRLGINALKMLWMNKFMSIPTKTILN